MGAHFFPLSSSLISTRTPFSIIVPTHLRPSSQLPTPLRFRSIKLIPNAAPRHRINNTETFKSERSKFSVDDDELFTDGEDDFGFGGRTKQRVWWSDEIVDVEDQDDDDDDDDQEFWIIKVLKAFGWMVPAVGLSMLLGTGTNTLFMAIALPLGQSVLSFAMDIVGGKPLKRRTRPRNQSRTKRKPSTKTARNFTANEIRRAESTRSRSRQKQTSRISNDSRANNGNKSSSSKYGGWDDLVNENVSQQKHRKVPMQNIDGFGEESGKGKLSRRGRNRERPLFVRLLIAVFPFLGSWSKLIL